MKTVIHHSFLRYNLIKTESEFFQLSEKKMPVWECNPRSLAYGANALLFKLTGSTANEHISLKQLY